MLAAGKLSWICGLVCWVDFGGPSERRQVLSHSNGKQRFPFGNPDYYLKIITNVMYSVLIYITMKFYEKVPEFILVLTLCRCIVPCLRSLGPLLAKNYLVGVRKFKMNGRDFVRKGMLYLGNNFICFFLEESCPQKRFGERSEGLQLPNE